MEAKDNDRSVGVDVGSRTIALVLLVGDEVVRSDLCDTGREPLGRCRELLAGLEGVPLLVTGYGRNLAREAFGAKVVTEITAVARGAYHLDRGVRTVLDIGGQDTKIIALDGTGGTADFRMNDRCAAGTGKYLEMMARSMELDLPAFVDLARSTDRAEMVTSTCAVYAESEMVSLLAAGADSAALARGLHTAVADRVDAMARQIECARDLLFVGGVALNQVMVELLAERFPHALKVPEAPQHVAALGAAILARTQGLPDWSL